jgi:hypothetical protein
MEDKDYPIILIGTMVLFKAVLHVVLVIASDYRIATPITFR